MEPFENILSRAEETLRGWFCKKDSRSTLEAFDRRAVVWTGMDEEGSAHGYAQLERLFSSNRDKIRPRALSGLHLEVCGRGEGFCVVTGSFDLQVVDTAERDHCRLTLVYTAGENGTKIIHGHVSAPGLPAGVRAHSGEPVSWAEYERLRLAFEEKAAQIEMIARTTAGGMKGSLDDDKYTYFYVNDELCEMLGYTHDEFMEMSGGTAVGAVYPPDLPAALASVAECFAKGPEYHAEYRIRKKDGSLLWVMDSGRKVKNARGEWVINSIITDISALKEAAEQLRIERERYEIVAELAGETIFEYDLGADTLQEFLPAHAGQAPSRRCYTGLRSGEAMGTLGLHPDDQQRLLEKFSRAEHSPQPEDLTTYECRRLLPDGSYGWRRILLRFICDRDGRPIRAVGKVVDISSERLLLQKSRTDALTGAYNRAYLEHAVEKYLAQKPEEVFAACLMIDIDHFKQLNDSCGHLCGDTVLTDLVGMLKRLYRATDLVARLGGDEFMVFMKDIYSVEIVHEKAQRLLQIARQYAGEAGISFAVTLSIGVATTREGAKTFEQLYREADIALYAAKAAGRDRYRLYEPGMQYPGDEQRGGE